MSTRVFVAGLGWAGRRHLANLETLGYETAGGRLEQAASWRPDALVIATPTSHHLEALRWAVERGVHTYVEKPIAASTEGVSELLAAAEDRDLTVAVGYNLRFHPALEVIRAAVEEGRIGRLLSVRAEVGQYLPDWQPDRDYRQSYAARRELGGGALLTLSHELDYVRWIAGEVVECRGLATRVSDLDLDVDDVAEVILRHESGMIGSVHLDMLDRRYNRRSRWVGSDGTIAWEWAEPVLLGEEALWAPDGFDIGETYLAALRDFLLAAAGEQLPRAQWTRRPQSARDLRGGAHVTTIAVIPARGGSKGVPGKNLRPLAGRPLLLHSLALAALCPEVARVVVSTDSDEIAAVALAAGAEVLHATRRIGPR